MQASPSPKRMDVEEGLFVHPRSASQAPQLLASRCSRCDEVTFPKQLRCANCSCDAVEEVAIGPRGKLWSFTNVNYPVPDGYKGPVPYGVGMIEMPEGVRLLAHLTCSDPRELRVGMDMTLVLDPLFVDEEGSEVVGFKFQPVSR